jgi:hypothetical protein
VHKLLDDNPGHTQRVIRPGVRKDLGWAVGLEPDTVINGRLFFLFLEADIHPVQAHRFDLFDHSLLTAPGGDRERGTEESGVF